MNKDDSISVLFLIHGGQALSRKWSIRRATDLMDWLGRDSLSAYTNEMPLTQDSVQES